MVRLSTPKEAMDYPKLADDLWILWRGNEYKWPDGRRTTMYLTDRKRNIISGHALFSHSADDAMTFSTEDEARAWLATNQDLRGAPYIVNTTTVGEMKKERGYE